MTYDAIVIGGSFAGLSAAIQIARARRRVLLIDAGLPRNRFADASHGFLGQDGRRPQDIIGDARRQLSLYPTVEFIDSEAVSASKTDGDFAVTLADGSEKRAMRLILATGVKDDLPAIPGLPERWGQSVLHCPYCHGYEVGGQALGVLANTPMSAHQALLISDWGPTTYFTQNAFEPDAEQLSSLAVRNVQIERTPVAELLGNAPRLEAVRLADGRVVPVDAVFTAPKTSMASPLAQQLGCAFDDGPLGAFIRVDDWMQTTVKGVYAAGDAASSMANATMAAAAGVKAGVGAHQSLVFAT
ncbi:thioredoxin reductase [Phyllobacterium myrsinacearum]|uniref:NAD(P)/FAD-dependent oxidoreductase n=1 Tax=Phyllobacterium myrsinacearum TaxID=28101 RepID=UPI00102899CF|nr:NAD(P)/FAD-dependent oxidoreductase [Phyllobacterium myrsinacearum]RZS77665.1 thioredoxin reductase [Phyllobacterium myrsinacearum]